MKKVLVFLLIAFIMLSTGVFAEENVVNGTVLDTLGKPAANVAVYLIQAPACPVKQAQLLEKTQTNDEGKFAFGSRTLEINDTQSIEVIAYEPGKILGSQVFNYYQKPIFSDIKISSFELGNKTGKVVDENGNPIEGVSVSLKMAISFSPVSGSTTSCIYFNILKDIINFPSATSDKDGDFTLSGVPVAVSTFFNAIKPGYALEEDEMMMYFASSKPINIPLKLTMVPSGGINGKVVNAEGKPAQLRVALRGKKNPGTTYDVKSNADGTFEIKDIFPANYIIYYSEKNPNNSLPFTIREIDINAGNPTNIGTLKTATTVQFSGTLLDSNMKPVSDENIVLSEKTDCFISVESVSDSKGMFKLQIVPGEYSIRNYKTGSSRIHFDDLGEVEINSKGLLNYSLKKHPVKFVKGIVFDTDNKPASKITINTGFDQVETDDNGNFVLQLPFDKDRYSYYFDQYGDGEETITLVATDNKKLGVTFKTTESNWLKNQISIKLIEMKPVNIFVTTNTGKPVEGAKISSRFMTEQYKTDAAGKAVITTLPMGADSRMNILNPAELDNRYGGSDSLVIDAQHSQSLYTYVFPPSQTIKGIVENVKGEPISGIRITLDERFSNPIAVTDNEGRFEFEHVKRYQSYQDNQLHLLAYDDGERNGGFMKLSGLL